MFKKFIVLVGIMSLVLGSQAQDSTIIADTDKYLANQFIVHQVEQGQTLFSIAANYGLKPADVRQLNPSVDNTFTIKPGQLLKLPVLKNGDAAYKSRLNQLNKEPILHKVEQSQGLFGIKRAYGLSSVDQIKEWNNLSSNDLALDQELIVGWRYNSKPGTVIPTVDKGDNVLNPNPVLRPQVGKQGSLEQRFLADKAGKTAGSEKGMAIWFDADNRMMSSNYYALYNGAPRGSILKITNAENNRSVYVKVIGGLPATGENTGAMIKLTDASKKQLRASSSKTRVQVNFFQ